MARDRPFAEQSGKLKRSQYYFSIVKYIYIYIYTHTHIYIDMVTQSGMYNGYNIPRNSIMLTQPRSNSPGMPARIVIRQYIATIPAKPLRLKCLIDAGTPNRRANLPSLSLFVLCSNIRREGCRCENYPRNNKSNASSLHTLPSMHPTQVYRNVVKNTPSFLLPFLSFWREKRRHSRMDY